VIPSLFALKDVTSLQSDSIMVENNHTFSFSQGEQFNGMVDDETIIVIQVDKHTIVWDYTVNGRTIGRNRTEKEKARTFVRCGTWKPQ